MGAWGTESFSNDTTMDKLCSLCKDIYEPTQEEVDIFLRKYNEHTEYESEKRLGVIVWFLQHKMEIPNEYLLDCLNIIEDEQESNTSGWFNFDERLHSLELEKEIIQSALDHGGRTKKKFGKEVGDILHKFISVCEKTRGENELVDV